MKTTWPQAMQTVYVQCSNYQVLQKCDHWQIWIPCSSTKKFAWLSDGSKSPTYSLPQMTSSHLKIRLRRSESECSLRPQGNMSWWIGGVIPALSRLCNWFVGGTVVYDGYCCISFSVLSSDVMHQAVQNGFQPLLGQCSLVNNHQPPPPSHLCFFASLCFCLSLCVCFSESQCVCLSVCLSVCLVRMGGWFVQAMVLDFVWQTLVG